jgi:hypothetical protein
MDLEVVVEERYRLGDAAISWEIDATGTEYLNPGSCLIWRRCG